MHDVTHDTDRPAVAEDNARDRHLLGKGSKRMLALDGGGERGAITVAFLERIEEILAEEQRYSQAAGQQVTRFSGTALGSPLSGATPTPPNSAIRLGDWFDLVGGTSTGAIIATALELGSDTAMIKELYLERAAHVFKSRFGACPACRRNSTPARLLTKSTTSSRIAGSTVRN